MKYYDYTSTALYRIYWVINCITKGNFDDNGTIIAKFVLPKKSQKEFRTILDGFYYENQDKIAPEILEKISFNNSYQDIIHFLHNNYIKTLDNLEKSKADNLAVCSDFSDDICDILINFEDIWISNGDGLKVNENGELKIISRSSFGFEDFLVLKQVIMSPVVENRAIDGFELSKVNDIYILELAFENEVVTIQFQDAKCTQQFFNYSSIGIGMTFTNDNCQWIIVANLFDELRNLEVYFGAERLSSKEKALLPLTHFAPLMEFCGYYDFANHNESGITLFENYTKVHGAEFLLPLLYKLKKCKPVDINNIKHNTYSELKHISKKISSALRDKRCEPLWRQIYNDLRDAASSYPQKIDTNREETDKMRCDITQSLLSQGFEGEYPHFKKMSVLKGLKLLENQTNTYFVGNEKNMASYICCVENSLFSESLSVVFLCGTIFLKEGQTDKFAIMDAYSAFFLDKGRRYTTVVYPKYPDFRDNLPIFSQEADVALVAAKKACLQNISKEEKSLTSVIDNTSVFAILIVFTILGTLLFGLAMTIGFVLITALVGLIFTFSFKETFGMIASVPWHWVFIGTGLPFGIIMGTITVFAKKKR